MKNLCTCLVLIVLALVTGCASTAPLRPADGSAFSATPGYVPPPTGPAMMVAPGGQMPMGYPQSYAWLDKRVPGCESGPLAVRIMNQTDYFVKFMVDGVELQVFGAQGPLPGFIPPSSTAWICLAKNGDVALSGIAYVKRPNGPTGTYSLQEVDGDLGRFNLVRSFGPATDSVLGHHQFPMDNMTFFFN
jgi:hypothetical protein